MLTEKEWDYHYCFELVKEKDQPKMLTDWINNWECMWINFKVPDNPEKDFVFQPYLQFSKFGFVCLKDDPWTSAEREIIPEDFRAIEELIDITTKLKNKTGLWGI